MIRTGGTVIQGNLKWPKQIWLISRMPWERPHWELRNEPPLDCLELSSLTPLVASLWIGYGHKRGCTLEQKSNWIQLECTWNPRLPWERLYKSFEMSPHKICLALRSLYDQKNTNPMQRLAIKGLWYDTATHMSFKFGIFLGEMHRHLSHEEEQKKLFCCSQVVLAWGLFEGFFWPEEGRRPSEGQKNPSRARRLKQAWLKQNNFFCSSKWFRNVVHWP